jgi:hypothetical protein
VPNAAGPPYLWEGRVQTTGTSSSVVAAAWPFNEKLRLDGAAIWQKTDGGVDFFTPNNFGDPQPDPRPTTAFTKNERWIDEGDLRPPLGERSTSRPRARLTSKYSSSATIQIDGYLYGRAPGTTQKLSLRGV